MRTFTYRRAEDVREAIEASASPHTTLIAGGTELIPLWRVGVKQLRRVIDISRLPHNDISIQDLNLHVGAMCLMSQLGDSSLLEVLCPMVRTAIAASASPQVRNRATVGGNLMQRTRCAYFRAIGTPCNKREPGTGCAAIPGENRLHAIFGGSSACVATHASDLAVALVAADARLTLLGSRGERNVSLGEFYVMPGGRPDCETVLQAGEIITSVEIPLTTLNRRSCYLKVRDRASFEFAVVSIAAALEMTGPRIRNVRLVAGGVGTIPWRLHHAESVLQGAEPSEDNFCAAAAAAVIGAEPLAMNSFKVPLLKQAVLRALQSL